MIDGDYEMDPRWIRDSRCARHDFQGPLWDWLSPTDDEGTEAELCWGLAQ